MKAKMFVLAVVASAGTVLTPQSAAAQQILHGHVPEAITRSHLQPIGRLPSTNQLALAIGLPLRDTEILTNFLEQLYDPASTNYHHYLTPLQFTERFGPTEQDYQALIAFAKTNGLTVTGTYPNRTLLDVKCSVADVENALHVTIWVYKHPKEKRTFYAPSIQPSIHLSVPVLRISGLDNFIVPHHAGLENHPIGRMDNSAALTGSGPGGNYWGWDFRDAYLGQDVKLLGAGQVVGLFEFASYDPADILEYENMAGIPLANQTSNPITLTNIPVGIGPLVEDKECALDIDMVISMAPGLSKVVLYEGYYTALGNNAPSILQTMANDTNNSVAQFSCSWFFDTDSNVEQALLQFISQGQSFFQASGDDGAYSGPIVSEPNGGPPADDPHLTSVGGTCLTTTGTSTSPTNEWASETTWQGSGGGVSTTYPLPAWQNSVDMSFNGGSTSMRNIPDVAMVATNIAIVYKGTLYAMAGTSCAAPLWAGFTALINQQAAINGHTNVGFLNPALYRIGSRPPISGYPFHDVADGSNNGNGHNVFYAVPGYDLCTGWGTPNGTNLINALLATPPSITHQPQNHSLAIGATATFSVTVTTNTTSPVTYQWFWNDTYHPLHDEGNINGSLSNTLTISNVQATNAGSYFVLICNPATCVTSTSAVLTVYVTAPSITITFDDLATPSLSEGLHYGPIPSGYDGLVWNNFYVANGVLETNTGYYAGVISTSNVAFNGYGSRATITNQTSFDLISAYLTACWNDNLQVAVTGYAGSQSTPTYSNNYTLSATTSTLIPFNYFGVRGVTFTSSGGTPHTTYGTTSYHQFAMDNLSVTTNITVATPPTIVTQPTNQAVILGAQVTFSVSAAGTAPLAFQWLKNGIGVLEGGNIVGSETSSLSISNISMADVGSYSVIVSNAYGWETSTSAVLALYMTSPLFLITFDELATPENDTVDGSFYGYDGPIPANYYSLNWNNFRVFNGIGAVASGYEAGTLSLSNVVFNVQANPANVASTAPFNFVSAYLTAGWNDNLQVEVLGYVGSAVAYSNTYTLSATAPTFITFNYLGVNEVYFSSSGGVHHSAYVGTGTHFVMDNVMVATNLPVSIVPTIQKLLTAGNTILFSWATMLGQTYQVQYKTNLTQTDWSNVGGLIAATSGTFTVSDSITNSQRFYRIVLMP